MADKYKIAIEKITEESMALGRYSGEEIYKQTVPDIDLIAIIDAVNIKNRITPTSVPAKLVDGKLVPIQV